MPRLSLFVDTIDVVGATASAASAVPASAEATIRPGTPALSDADLDAIVGGFTPAPPPPPPTGGVGADLHRLLGDIHNGASIATILSDLGKLRHDL